MSISEKANDLLNKFGRAQFDFVVWSTQDNLVARNKARQEISDYIEEIEAENDQLTAHSDIERQDDKCSKPEPNVCEACGGDGTVLLTDGYKGQVIATAKCIYCNGTGRVNKESEE